MRIRQHALVALLTFNQKKGYSEVIKKMAAARADQEESARKAALLTTTDRCQ
jgi:hypothetical protein